MTTYLTKESRIGAQEGNNAIELYGIGKKFPLSKNIDIGLTPNHGEFWALKEVSLSINSGLTLGVIGRNGAGKTTLLSIICGALSPTEGKIFVKGRVIGLFNLGVGFQDELSARENIFLNGAILGASRQELKGKLNAIVEFSELGEFIDMPLGSYSQGMRLRLGFSIIANLDFDVLLLDEVLAVGDILFQSKCFQRLADFKRNGRTLVISNQNMDLIGRLCDKVALLEHGSLLFYGHPDEAINKYRILLSTERFSVGPLAGEDTLVRNTKKWSEDMQDWGKKLGNKEATIEGVEFINKSGRRCKSIKSCEPLKVRVKFHAKNRLEDIHFGVAIFRNDGLYCYGPNTSFDGHIIPSINSGAGEFELDYKKIFLAPGEYRISVCIWDKNEALPFDYHNGFYPLTIEGKNENGQLARLPFKAGLFKGPRNDIPAQEFKRDMNGQDIGNEKIILDSIRLLNPMGQERHNFMTLEPAKIAVNFSKIDISKGGLYLWIGLFRDDGIYCQGVVSRLRGNTFTAGFPKLSLLPGGYFMSLGVWDARINKFIFLKNAAYAFHMFFTRKEHGTIYLEHAWKWRCP